MASEIGPVEYRAFHGGMNSETVDLLLPPETMRLIRNMDTDIVGGLRPRRGFSVVGDQVQDGKTCLGLYNFRDSGSGSNHRLISAFNNAGDTQAVTSYLNGASWSAIGGGSSFTASAKFRFRTFLDYTFVTNSAHNPVLSWNGDTATNWGTTHLSSAPAGQFPEVFNDKLYLGHTVANPDRLYFSTVPTVAGVISWSTTEQYLDVNPEDGMNMTGLHNNGLYLLIFKERAMYRWNGRSVEANLLFDVGCTSNESIATRNGLTFFFNPYGIFITQGDRPVIISKPIQRWIDAIDPAYFDQVSGECDEDNYYCSIGDVTVDGVSYSNAMLVYSISMQGWRIYTYDEEIRYMARYTDDSGLFAIVAGNDDGDVHQLNNTNLDGTDQIPYEFQTGRIGFGTYSQLKSFSHLFSFADEIPGFEFQMETDTEPFRTIIEQTEFASQTQGLNARGRYFRFAGRGEARGTRGLFHVFTITDLGVEG